MKEGEGLFSGWYSIICLLDWFIDCLFGWAVGWLFVVWLVG